MPTVINQTPWLHLGKYWVNMLHVQSIRDEGMHQPPTLTFIFAGGQAETVGGEQRKQAIRWLVQEVEGVPGNFLTFPETLLPSVHAGE